MRISSLMRYTALAAVLASPAFAQTAVTSSMFNPQQILGTNSQNSTLNASAVATGLTATSIASQLNTNNLNQLGGNPLVGGTVAPLFSGDPTVSIGQVVGGIGGVGPGAAWGAAGGLGTAADSFRQTTANINNATSRNTQGYLSTVIAGGGQNATSGVNTAGLGVISGASLSIQQALNQSQASLQNSANTITASAMTGAATVNGYNGVQNAQSALNTSSIGIGSTTNAAGQTVFGNVLVGLDQKQLGAPVTQISTNIANSAVFNGPNPVIDPSVINLNQNAGLQTNVFSASNGALQLQNGAGQIGQFAAGNNVLSLGNSATASTGTGAGTVGAAAGTGTASISGVTQNALSAANNASNTGGNLIFGDSVTPFTQNIAAGYTGPTGSSAYTVVPSSISGAASGPAVPGSPSSFGGGVYANVVNNQSTQSAYGDATVTGTPLSATNGTASQYFTQALNSASSTGVLSGYLAQTAGSNLQGATPYTAPGGVGTTPLTNLATANTTFGSAAVTSISQGQNNTLNTVTGSAGVGLQLQQAAAGNGIPGVAGNTLGGANVQTATTAGGAATVSGAYQSLNAGANVANLGGVLNGTISQLATSINTNNTNTLKAAGGAAVVTGTQSAISGVNVIK